MGRPPERSKTRSGEGDLSARSAPRAVGDSHSRRKDARTNHWRESRHRGTLAPHMPLPPVDGLLVSTDAFLAQRVRPRGEIEPVRQNAERNGISPIAGITEHCDLAIGVLADDALHRLVPRTVRHEALPKDFGAAWPLLRTDIRTESNRVPRTASGDRLPTRPAGSARPVTAGRRRTAGARAACSSTTCRRAAHRPRRRVAQGRGVR